MTTTVALLLLAPMERDRSEYVMTRLSAIDPTLGIVQDFLTTLTVADPPVSLEHAIARAHVAWAARHAPRLEPPILIGRYQRLAWVLEQWDQEERR